MTVGPNTRAPGLHAFVFVDHSEIRVSELIETLAEHRDGSPRVHWAGSVVGDYKAFVHIWADDDEDLAGLQDFIDGTLWDAGAHCQKALELKVAAGKGTKHSTPDVLALVGIKTEHGQAMRVMEELEKIDEAAGGEWLQGASLVTGHLDILVQLNAPTLGEAMERILDPRIASLPGVSWTSTAVADGRRGPFAD
jgi:hypothetical protein